jgi:hypothetical protein
MYAGGTKSARVEMSWPSLTKVGARRLLILPNKSGFSTRFMFTVCKLETHE